MPLTELDQVRTLVEASNGREICKLLFADGSSLFVAPVPGTDRWVIVDERVPSDLVEARSNSDAAQNAVIALKQPVQIHNQVTFIASDENQAEITIATSAYGVCDIKVVHHSTAHDDYLSLL